MSATNANSDFRFRWLLAAIVVFIIRPQFVTAQEAAVVVEPKTRMGVVAKQPASGLFVKIEGGFMVPYTATIPGTDVKFQMVPVPGGTFTMGSPIDEEGRLADEGPQFDVVVKPFWMGKHEVTWDEYHCYLDMEYVFKELNHKKIRKTLKKFSVDAVTAPSELYDPVLTYDAGDKPNQPAATATQFAAKQYTKWLSVTGRDFYRLPYEAEWEYACRAGSKTAYSFGLNVDDLKEYAWYIDNSDEERHIVGTKKANAFGIFDMHGNVAEWVLDGYDKKGYTHLKAGKTYTVEQTFNKPKTVYSRVVRGGSFELQASQCRSAARLCSSRDWKSEDPDSPESPWWLTDFPGTGVGFRLIRPLEVPKTLQAKDQFWKPDHPDIAIAAELRFETNGRGALGKVDENLAEEMAEVLRDK